MKVQAINNNYNNPNFGAFRVSHSPEMKAAKQVLKKNCPEYYNTLMSGCEEALKNTKILDGFLDIEHGQLVMRLQRPHNFQWPGKTVSATQFDAPNFYPRLDRYTTEVEFSSRDNGMLRFRELDENDRVVNYTVKELLDNGEWSDKASVKQAKLIKELDNNMLKIYG